MPIESSLLFENNNNTFSNIIGYGVFRLLMLEIRPTEAPMIMPLKVHSGYPITVHMLPRIKLDVDP